ncbi:hypothetical protein FR483_n065R [Paramecium bursaria Chlorella virus FR483]|uniref:Uncharacterized protein n065R n=1 Tax=Paramecium bursaria Chlorella virus FR483 TaxID=399781 RepID=A7J6B9_PBCVF|nr:hypothetical protein FR483_n065R [Paramecium bursaria Chlorella virus FR483]ABT15350.1 hypothetical protein FR483_n065R [Paramecium bursaria Chlorella virus FR483]
MSSGMLLLAVLLAMVLCCRVSYWAPAVLHCHHLSLHQQVSLLMLQILCCIPTLQVGRYSCNNTHQQTLGSQHTTCQPIPMLHL